MVLLAGVFTFVGDGLLARVLDGAPARRAADRAADRAGEKDPGVDDGGTQPLLVNIHIDVNELARELAEELREAEPELTVGIDLREGAQVFPEPEAIELEGGARIGAPDLYPATDEVFEEGDVRFGPLVLGDVLGDALAPEVEPPVVQVRRRRARPSRPPVPRLHPNPGVHTILTARRMIANGEAIQGSCYRYLSTVYERAGHDGWRNRRIVYREGKDGPYARLDLIRPGDWLYIVNHPDSDPVGTHSVMFVGWQDRAQGWGRVISHPGWGAPHTGRESTYDLTRTYRIIRPVLTSGG